MKLIIFLISLVVSSAVIAKPHKCENNGKVTFQESPCPGEIERSEPNSEAGARELFEKFFISEISVEKGKKSGEMTQIFYEITAKNNTNNQVSINLTYDGIDKNDISIDTLTTGTIIDRNTTKKIKVTTFKRNGIIENVKRYRFRNWSSHLK